MIRILYQDRAVAVVLKPPGVLSTDEPGGMPELTAQALGEPELHLRTVHRLDRVVGGLLVLAKTRRSASELSRQIREGSFEKTYLAVVHGQPQPQGTFRDLLARDKQQRMTYVTPVPSREAQEAILHYRLLAHGDGMSQVHIRLETGRTHQIRCQFSSRGFPLVGDKKYGLGEGCDIALWSHSLSFAHPYTGQKLSFTAPPPDAFPWKETSPTP